VHVGQRHGKVSASAEEAIRSKILEEQELERLKEEEETIRRQEQVLEREIEEELRELTSDELGVIFGAPEFTDFVEQSSKIVERALTDSYDYMKDYTLLNDRTADDYEGRQVNCQRVFWDETLCRGRSITDLGWSTKHPELIVASYSRSDEAATDEPDGLVLVWNVHLADRPEFTFHAQTDVLSVCFSPFHPNLIIGGTYSGQILIWDTRARALPVLKTPLSAAGHTHPVYSIQMVGTQNAHNLITASTDGTVCSWMLDMLARPQETLELLNSTHPKTDEISVTVLGFPDQETTNFWVGTEEGNVYQAARYDRAGFKAGLNTAEVYRGHAAPITGLHFHPLHGAVDFSDLFLSSSMDWTSRLWRLKGSATNASTAAAAAAATTTTISPSSSSASTSAAMAVLRGTSQRGETITPILTFEEANDYIYDVAWHTIHPALFAQVDGTGRFDLFNLNVDVERPIVSIAVGSNRALNKIKWDKKDGRRAAMGGADGRVYVYDVGGMAVPRDEEWIDFQKVVARLMNSNSTGTASSRPFSAAQSNNQSGPSSSADHTMATPLRAMTDLDRISQRLEVR
jgi:dynein intermediate chain